MTAFWKPNSSSIAPFIIASTKEWCSAATATIRMADSETRQLRATAAQDVACIKCHSEKAGPFVHEHPPVKTEGCVSCHTPHGSANPPAVEAQPGEPVVPGVPLIDSRHRRPQLLRLFITRHRSIRRALFVTLRFMVRTLMPLSFE